MDEERKSYIGVPGSPELISRDALPPALTNTLDHIIGQLTLIGRTMSIFEQRLSLTENRISAIAANARGLQAVVPEEYNQENSNIQSNGEEDDDEIEEEYDDEYEEDDGN